MPKHIGIVACSAEGAALCFREIAAYSLKLMGEHMHPQVTLSCIALGEWMPAFNRGDYEDVAEFMLRETEIVANAGAQLAICPDNSAHLADSENHQPFVTCSETRRPTGDALVPSKGIAFCPGRRSAAGIRR